MAVTRRAVDSFRYHHGGGVREAEVQLRGMLEDFILLSARQVAENGFVRLSREGFSVTLSPDMDTVVGYTTVHRERTWEQVKAGVRSRISRKNRYRPGGDEALPPLPEPGPPVSLDDFAATVAPETIFLTARVHKSWARIARDDGDWDETFAGRIRAVFAVALESGQIIRRDKDGLFEVTAGGRVWLVSADVGVLVGVKAHRPGTSDEAS